MTNSDQARAQPMITPDYVKMMAHYHAWQNAALVEAAGQLTDDQRKQDRGAFFGSIFATMNHLLWGDQVWLQRLAGTPAPNVGEIRKSSQLHANWDDYVEGRKATDGWIGSWADRVTTGDLNGDLTWTSNVTGETIARPRAVLAIQLFNHGTHHRGQINTMLTALGAQMPDTDLQYMPGYWVGVASSKSGNEG